MSASLRDVGDDRQRPAAGGDDLGRDRLEPIRAPRADRQRRPAARQPQRRRAPDARRRAGIATTRIPSAYNVVSAFDAPKARPDPPNPGDPTRRRCDVTTRRDQRAKARPTHPTHLTT